ncbi:MAG: cation transporter [Clostridia bacterium]|nr:cation transporter [Clostridia bacterium]
MQKTMKISGMMCHNCENHVKKALEAVPGVASAEVSHVKGEAVVTLNAEVSDETLRQAVEAQDYEVKGIA